MKREDRWYEEAFGPHYLTVYAHRNESSADAEAEFAATALDLCPGDLVLDLACGWGRHARALAGRELRVIGLDLSPALLARAMELDAGPAYLRGDMRALPFGPCFRAVLLFFTSFGYFRETDEDRRVLEGVAETLRPGGGFLLDYLNRDRVVKGLVPESESEIDGIRIRERRWIDGDGERVMKHVRMEIPGEPEREYTESVRLYSRDRIEEMLEAAGIEVVEMYGDLAGNGFGDDSPRLVAVGRRTC